MPFELSANRLHVLAGCLWVSSVVAGCSASQNTGAETQSASAAAISEPANSTGAPISLIRKRVQPLGQDARMPVEQAGVENALRRIATNRKADVSAAQVVGVDLNADGIGEALVYLEGETWCVRTGCTLLVLRDQGRGFWPFAEIKRIKLPVVLAHTASRGWRDILARTGGGGMRRMTVKLTFGPDGYPKNATVLAPFPGDVVANGTVLMDADGSPDTPATAKSG